MIAKIVKGSSFKGVVNYILDKGKNAKIIALDGLFAENKETIASSFEAQARMNPKVTKPVGHIALAFSKEDEHRLTDRAMAGLALEYLKKMGINDTQILIVRHFDKEHPHTRICKELTRKYGLYFADGKEQVKRHRLKEPDKTRYELYSILKIEVARCGNWRQLMANLEKQGVEVRFKYKGKSDDIQGVIFSKNGYPFSGSKIDRRFSYSKIDAALNANRHEERQQVMANQTADYRHPAPPPSQFEPKGSDDLYSGSIGLFMPDNSNAQADENYFEEQLKRKNKKKKQRKIRF